MTVQPSAVSVVICAYTFDRSDDVRDAIAAVKAQTAPARETILSVDGNEELLVWAQREFPAVTVIPNTEAPGLSGARNSAIGVASGEVIAFIDDDAVPELDWLAELVRAFDDERVLGAGGMCVPDFATARPRWLAPEFDWVVGGSHAGMPKTQSIVRNVIAANMAIRREVLDAVGAFTDDLGRLARPGKTVTGTADETDFCIRSARLLPGRYWVYRPQARVNHRVPAARVTWRYFVARCRLEGTAKANIAAREGDSMALESERAYTRSVLPRAVVRELRAAVRGDLGGLKCAAAIVTGTAITVSSYAAGRLRRRRG